MIERMIERVPAVPRLRADGGVELFIARQPIFDRRNEVVAYELLLRSGPENRYRSADGTQATAELITGLLLTLGVDELTALRPAYINFTRDLLLNESYALLPPGRTVIELLEEVRPDAEVIAACRRLKASGYRLALDDVTSVEDRAPLLEFADVVKVDFRASDAAGRARLLRALRAGPRRAQVLAEKVETGAEFERAFADGYDYFQGHYLSRPLVLSGREIPAFKLNLIELLHTAHRQPFDFDALEAVIKRDVSLSFKMLRFANAAALGLGQRIGSVKHALVMLGQEDVVRAVSLLALAGLGVDRPQELGVRSVVRAGFCESVAPAIGLGRRRLECFLAGMFSLIDVLLDAPMHDVIPRLPTGDAVNAALLGVPGVLRDVLDLALAYEDADWARVGALATRLGVAQEALPAWYRAAVRRANEVFALG